MDNFRGFSNKFLEIKDINFFVGENSTGKTSVLLLINLLSNMNFWFNQDFNSDDVKLGYFDDIVSKFSSNKSYFTIGYLVIDEIERKNQNDRVKALIIKYIKKASLPQISEFRYIEKGFDIHAAIKQKKLLCKINKVDNIKEFIDSSDTSFKEWVDKFQTEDITQYEPDDLIVIKSGPWPDNLFLLKSIIMQKMLSSEEKPQYVTSDIPTFLNVSLSIAPIRTKPKKVYEGFRPHYSPEGEHIPFLLKSIFDVRSISRQKKEVREHIEAFGEESGLFQSITIKRYGKEKTSPFEINITLNGRSFKIATVGYGVSQVLPILADSVATPKGYWFLIQQPEIHLHPKAQASLGELIYNLYQSDKKKFIIETHSDYIIDRFRFCQSKEKKMINGQVIFFLRTEIGNDAYEINIEQDGKYNVNQPTLFKEFFVREQIKMLDI